MRKLICIVVAVTTVGCAAYYLWAGAILMVLFFVPIGEITTRSHPVLFWTVVCGHVAVARVAALAIRGHRTRP